VFTDVDRTWQALARDGPVELMRFRCWSGASCGCRISFSLSSIL